MPDRRQFLRAAAVTPAALIAAPALTDADARRALAAAARRRPADATPARLAQDETYWAEIGRAFTVDRSLLNLNNGGVSPAPAFVQDAQRRHLAFSNQAPVYTMWRVLEPQVEGVRQQLAAALGCDKEELALTRNASESLQICQQGFDLKRGDKVLTTDQDYPRMLATFRQRARREGIELIELPLPQPCDDPARIVAAFEQHLDRHRPKLVLVSHVLYTTGQVMPVREVVAAARARGVPTIVDGAHAIAHLDFSLEDLDCDYYGASLHKWLFAPHGTGALYVRRDKIRGLWPMMAAEENLDDDIRKFEQIGTHPVAQTLAIGEALQFHRGIGAAVKQARLTYLREYWLQRLVDRQPDRFEVHTSRAPGQAGGIATLRLKDVPSGKLSSHLFRRHRIITTVIRMPHFEGMRVSPSVYTSLADLDRFCAAVQSVVDDGLPG